MIEDTEDLEYSKYSKVTRPDLAQDLENQLRFTLRLGLLMLLLTLILIVAGALLRPEVADPGVTGFIAPVYIFEAVAGLMVIVVRRAVLSSLYLDRARRKGRRAVLRSLAFLTYFGGSIAFTMGLTALVFCRLTGDNQYLVRIGGIGLLLALYSLPRREEWRSAVGGLD